MKTLRSGLLYTSLLTVVQVDPVVTSFVPNKDATTTHDDSNNANKEDDAVSLSLLVSIMDAATREGKACPLNCRNGSSCVKLQQKKSVRTEEENPISVLEVDNNQNDDENDEWQCLCTEGFTGQFCQVEQRRNLDANTTTCGDLICEYEYLFEEKKKNTFLFIIVNREKNIFLLTTSLLAYLLCMFLACLIDFCFFFFVCLFLTHTEMEVDAPIFKTMTLKVLSATAHRRSQNIIRWVLPMRISDTLVRHVELKFNKRITVQDPRICSVSMMVYVVSRPRISIPNPVNVRMNSRDFIVNMKKTKYDRIVPSHVAIKDRVNMELTQKMMTVVSINYCNCKMV